MFLSEYPGVWTTLKLEMKFTIQNWDYFLFLIEWRASLFRRTVAFLSTVWLCRLKFINGLFESSLVLWSNAAFAQPGTAENELCFSVSSHDRLLFCCSVETKERSGCSRVLWAAQEASDTGQSDKWSVLFLKFSINVEQFPSGCKDLSADCLICWQSVLKHRWSVLYLLLSLAEDPRKPSSRVKKRRSLPCG